VTFLCYPPPRVPNVQLANGYHVKRTTTIDESIRFLCSMHRSIEGSLGLGPAAAAGSVGGGGGGSLSDGCRNPQCQVIGRPGVSVDLLSFAEFVECGKKRAALTAQDAFSFMLRQVCVARKCRGVCCAGVAVGIVRQGCGECRCSFRCCCKIGCMRSFLSEHRPACPTPRSERGARNCPSSPGLVFPQQPPLLCPLSHGGPAPLVLIPIVWWCDPCRSVV
jgi:hypothetical protein